MVSTLAQDFSACLPGSFACPHCHSRDGTQMPRDIWLALGDIKTKGELSRRVKQRQKKGEREGEKQKEKKKVTYEDENTTSTCGRCSGAAGGRLGVLPGEPSSRATDTSFSPLATPRQLADHSTFHPRC